MEKVLDRECRKVLPKTIGVKKGENACIRKKRKKNKVNAEELDMKTDGLSSGGIIGERRQSESSKSKSQRANVFPKLMCPAEGCKAMVTARELRNHLQKMHADVPNHTDILKAFDTQAQQAMDFSGQGIPCQICQVVCGGVKSMMLHIKTCHKGDLQYKAAEASIKSKLRRRAHHKPKKISRQCPHCSAEFRTISSHYYHVRYKCPENPQRIKPLYCSVCGTRHRTQEHLQQHWERHHQDNFKRYTCNLCSCTYASRGSLWSHQRRVHQLTKSVPVTPYVCDVCGKGFPELGAYTRHLTKHSGEQRRKVKGF